MRLGGAPNVGPYVDDMVAGPTLTRSRLRTRRSS
jgi:hypothetical protein